MKEKFSLIVPTYNESANIEKLIVRLMKILREIDINFEIIIVDDDSPDGTWRIVEAISDNEKALKVVRRIGKRGLGSAVVEGWKNAEGEILGVIDGDLQHPPEGLCAMLRKICDDADIDIVIASRNVEGGGVSEWNIFRKAISWIGTSVSHFFLPNTLAGIKDPMSGYFILRKHVIKGVSLKPIGYKILIEVLAKGNYNKILEIPYIFEERKKGDSKIGLKQYILSLFHMIKLGIKSKEVCRTKR